VAGSFADGDASDAGTGAGVWAVDLTITQSGTLLAEFRSENPLPYPFGVVAARLTLTWCLA